AHEEVQLFLTLFAFGNVRYCADEIHGSSTTPVALEIKSAQDFHPADLAVSPTDDPKLVSVRPRFSEIERCVKGGPNTFHIVRMHPMHELFGCGPIRGGPQDFFAAHIPGKDPAVRIALPCP